MEKEKHIDPYLEKYLIKYDKWLNKRQIAYSSRVIPVSESLNAKQWVLPTEQVLSILRNASTVAVQNCACRTHYKLTSIKFRSVLLSVLIINSPY